MLRRKTLLASGVFLASMPAVRAAEEISVHPQLSPGGRWLAVLLESQREIPTPFGGGGRSYETTGQWLFRGDLAAEKPRPELLERQTGLKLGSRAPTYHDVVIDDDGAILALRDEAPQLVRWNATLERAEKRLFGDERCFVKMHLRPDGKELVVYRQLLGEDERASEAYSYDLSSGEIARCPALEGLVDHEIHWSRDLNHLFAAEVAGKAGEGESYKLVRLDLTTGERKTMAERVWFYGNCFGGSWLARGALCEDHEKKRKKHAHPFVKVSTSEPFEIVEVDGLADWHPVAAIDDDRVLCRSSDWKRHAIASVTEGKPKAVTLPMAASDRAIHYSRLLGAFVVFPRGRESECEVRSHDGKLIKKVRFDLKARLKKAK